MTENGDQGFVRIQSSELLFLESELANVGSRALAFAVDMVIKSLAILVIMLCGVYSGLFTGRAILVPLLLSGLVFTGFHVLFEAETLGKTPGKNIAGIRVVKTNGSRLSLLDVLIRNVLRTVDSLPIGYVLGMTVMFAERYNRRIGDIVAGTVVIYDRPSKISIKDFVESRMLSSPPAASPEVRGVELLSDEDRTLIKDLYLRLDHMQPAQREHICVKFYETMSRRVTIAGVTDPQRYLYDLYKRI